VELNVGERKRLKHLHRDHLGGVIAITDSSGAITRQERYKPFGETLWSAGTNTPTTQAYTGRSTLPKVRKQFWALRLKRKIV
jgi:uncharacterized protein RhaS with RHS repeats